MNRLFPIGDITVDLKQVAAIRHEINSYPTSPVLYSIDLFLKGSIQPLRCAIHMELKNGRLEDEQKYKTRVKELLLEVQCEWSSVVEEKD